MHHVMYKIVHLAYSDTDFTCQLVQAKCVPCPWVLQQNQVATIFPLWSQKICARAVDRVANICGDDQ